MITEVTSENDMKDFGQKLGAILRGGEVIELVGDVGAGKTTFVKGLAKGLAIDEDVQSPSFTISRVYAARDNLQLAHYDFYRLSDPGIMANELSEVIHDKESITVIEWADVVEDVLPANKISIVFASPTETSRLLTIDGSLELVGKL